MQIKRYTIVSFLLIAFVGWYVSTFVSSQTISVNLLGIEIPPLSVSIWAMIPLVVFYLASVTHIAFYSIVGSFNLRKYEKDYNTIIECISDAYLGKENRHHMFKTPKYQLLGSLIDNTALFPKNISGTLIDDEKISTTIKLIEAIKKGEVVDLKKASLSINNPLVIQNERNRYKSGAQSAEDFLKAPEKYNSELLREIYKEFVQETTLNSIEKFKDSMSKDALYTILSRVNADENTLEISNDTLTKLFEVLELNSSDFVKISVALSLMLPEQRMRLFETLSDLNDDAMDAYLFTLFDLEMMAPADVILEISQPHEYQNFKAYRALKECHQNFNINLFVTDRIC